jgi:hypothetical protein
MGVDLQLLKVRLSDLARIAEHGGAASIGHQHAGVMGQSFHVRGLPLLDKQHGTTGVPALRRIK